MADAVAQLAAEEGFELASGGEPEPTEGEPASTEAAAEPAPDAVPEAVDAAPPAVEEAAAEPDTAISVAEYYEKLAAKDARIRELEGAPKPEPHAVAAALESRDPGKVLAALTASGMDFNSIAQHVLDNPAGVPEAPEAPEQANPLEARIAQLEAALKAEADTKAAATAEQAAQAQQAALSTHITSKADQFPILAELGRADLVLNAMREAHGGTIPAFRSDAEAALVVEQSAKRVEAALAEELTGYAKQPAIAALLTKQLGLTAPPTSAPTRTGTRDGGGTDAPAFTNTRTEQRTAHGIEDEPDDEELIRRAASALEAQQATG